MFDRKKWLQPRPSETGGLHDSSSRPIGTAAGIAMAAILMAVVLGVALHRSTPVAETQANHTGYPNAGNVATFAPDSGSVPVELNGQVVYRLRDNNKWKDLNGPFLLGVSLPFDGSAPGCPPSQWGNPAEVDLMGNLCTGTSLGSASGTTQTAKNLVYAAPKGYPAADISNSVGVPRRPQSSHS